MSLVKQDDAREFLLRCHPSRVTKYDVNYLLAQLDQARSALADAVTRERRVRALIPVRPTLIYDEATGNYLGTAGGPEHRTVGSHRAWCYDAGEWCYPENLCGLCLPRIDVSELEEALA